MLLNNRVVGFWPALPTKEKIALHWTVMNCVYVMCMAHMARMGREIYHWYMRVCDKLQGVSTPNQTPPHHFFFGFQLRFPSIPSHPSHPKFRKYSLLNQHNYGKSPFLMDKPTVNEPFSIANCKKLPEGNPNQQTQHETWSIGATKFSRSIGRWISASCSVCETSCPSLEASCSLSEVSWSRWAASSSCGGCKLPLFAAEMATLVTLQIACFCSVLRNVVFCNFERKKCLEVFSLQND